MSVVVKIRTKAKDLDFREVLTILARDKGYKIVVTGLDDKFCQCYLHEKSTRMMEITKERGGYEVRITSFASRDEYYFFRDTVQAIMNITGGAGYEENDNGCKFIVAADYMTEEWIEGHMESSYMITWTMANAHENTIIHEDGTEETISEDGSPSSYFGPNSQFCIGEQLFRDLGITNDTPWQEGYEKIIERFRYSQYSRPDDIRRTSTNMRIKADNSAEDEPDKSITVYAQNQYDMISYADFVAILSDEEDMLLVPYKNFVEIAPESWERFDEYQFFTKDLSDSEYQELIDRARPFNVL